MSSNQEKLNYLAEKNFKVHLWDAGTKEEKYAQNNFVGRIATAVAAKILDWEIDLGDKKKTSLRTVLRWTAADFADVKARIDALSTQVSRAGSGGQMLTKDEQKAIYQQAVKDSLGTYEVRKVEPGAK